MQLVFDFPVNPHYTFENFVVCSGNELGFRFAELIARNDGQNVLYLYGPPGSGKTHLLFAVGRKVAATCDSPVHSPIPYVSLRDIEQMYGGRFAAEQPSQLAERFRNAPVLLVDDLHLIPDNVSVRLEIWQIFNDFFHAGRKIVVTGLHHPREIAALDDHLVSRFLCGLVAKMDVSDDECRRLIVKKLAEDRQVGLPLEVIDYLMVHCRRDIPSLLGAVESLHRKALSLGRKISVRLAKDVVEGKGR